MMNLTQNESHISWRILGWVEAEKIRRGRDLLINIFKYSAGMTMVCVSSKHLVYQVWQWYAFPPNTSKVFVNNRYGNVVAKHKFYFGRSNWTSECWEVNASILFCKGHAIKLCWDGRYMQKSHVERGVPHFMMDETCKHLILGRRCKCLTFPLNSRVLRFGDNRFWKEVYKDEV